MTNTTYIIENGTDNSHLYRVRIGGRIHRSLEALRAGPLQAPSPIRRSEHIRQFREAGMLIDTEMREQHDGQGQYGVYHLRSTVTPAVKVPA